MGEQEQYGYRPRRRWVKDDDGKRVVLWLAAAPDCGDWYSGFEDMHVSGIFKTKQQAAERCRAENISIWGDPR